MMQEWTLMAVLLLCYTGRIPRIVERWDAPFLNGPGWFFGIQVLSDFEKGAGRRILARYRARLFLLWIVELPVTIGVAVAGYWTIVFLLMAIFTLMTRLVYYANRGMAENAARRFQIPGTDKPVLSVTLSLAPRTLRGYTIPWIESAVGIGLLAWLAWLSYASAAFPAWHLLRGLWIITAFTLYIQFGLVLLKIGLVRARAVAPAENAEAYLLWRESLRRLSTALCDYLRLGFILPLVLVALALSIDRGSGHALAPLTFVFVLVVAPSMAWFEWRRRQQHLRVARQTKPVGFLVRPDAANLGLVCFRPALPALLLKGPRGYALNLASVSAMTAGLYLAGCAALVIGIAR